MLPIVMDNERSHTQEHNPCCFRGSGHWSASCYWL